MKRALSILYHNFNFRESIRMPMRDEMMAIISEVFSKIFLTSFRLTEPFEVTTVS